MTLDELKKQEGEGKSATAHKAVIKVETPDQDLRTFAQEEKKYWQTFVDIIKTSQVLVSHD